MRERGCELPRPQDGTGRYVDRPMVYQEAESRSENTDKS